ncbi:DEAD/DEAH box helicase [Aquipuribacter sp. SD81]|uniref:DEAD/DEAH box helicase n=1 Tax=Aquipuribacter sp. SD81 TaxID=3127703 RepID=UPI003016FA62
MHEPEVATLTGAGVPAPGRPAGSVPDLPPAARAVLADPRAAHCVRGVLVDPARRADTVPFPAWTHPALLDRLARHGIGSAWSHQVEAAEALRAGRHVVLSSGTASGKSLAYLLPVLSGVLDALDGPQGAHDAPCALYLSPTKALAADQDRRLRELGVPGLLTGTVDGDASREQRDWVRDHAHVVLSNPDLLAHALLPDHARWSRLLRRLRWVVVDECHVYRGVFGAHVGAVLRRLRRVAAAHGARPAVVLCSATVAEPGRFAERLLGEPVLTVDVDGSPHPGRVTVLWDPVVGTDGTGRGAGDGPGDGPGDGHGHGGEHGDEHGDGDRSGLRDGSGGARDVGADRTGGGPGSGPGSGRDQVRRRSATTESADLLAGLVGSGTRTLAFVGSRRGTEVIAARAREHLVDRHGALEGAALAGTVVPYRGGHLPEERRATERGLRDGSVRGVAATSALELGVDVVGLDAVVMAGWPGSLASWRQRLGRAGRADVPGTGVLVAHDDPLDAYVLAHPDRVLSGGHEAVTTDPDNPYVLLPHLAAAAAELPLTEVDLALFGPAAAPLVDVLVERGDLRRRPGGWFWSRPHRPGVDLRGSGGAEVQLVEAATGRVLGTVDASRATATVHPGAVYEHLLRRYVVEELDLDGGCALLRAEDPGYVTFSRSVTTTHVVAVERERALGEGGAGFGTLDVVEAVTGFVRVDPRSGAVLDQEHLDLPTRTMRTRGAWVLAPTSPDAPGGRRGRGAVAGRAVAALHAAEHALTSLVPLVTVSDRHDVGGSHDAHHPDLAGPAVLLHDTWPGGAGFAERAFEQVEALVDAAAEAVGGCSCRGGCPACVVRAGCGSGNQPLDKAGAVGLLRLLRG